MKPKFLPIATLFSCCLLQVAEGATAISWGVSTDFVTASQQFANLDTVGMRLGGFSGGDPLLLSPASGYTGGAFYGAVTWASTGSDGNYGAVEQRTGGDTIEIKRFNADIRALVLWQQTDFLNGLNTGNVIFDASSTVTMNLVTLANFANGRVVIRLQGGANDGYYISSEAPFDGTGAQSANFTALTWLAYNPAAGLATIGAATDIVTGGLIENVTEVGFYTASNSSNANAFRMSSFTFDAIPEPSSALFAVTAFGGLMLRRRK